MKKDIIFLVFIFTCFISISSCRGNKEGRVPDSLEPSSVVSTPASKENSMVASVNSIVITQKDMDREVENLMREFGGKVPPDQMVQVRSMLKKQALQNLINQILLVQKADKEGIEPEEKKIDDKVAEISGLFPTPEQFQQQLDAAGLSKEDLRKQIKQSLKIETLLQKPTSTIWQFYSEPSRWQRRFQKYWPNHWLPDPSPEIFRLIFSTYAVQSAAGKTMSLMVSYSI